MDTHPPPPSYEIHGAAVPLPGSVELTVLGDWQVAVGGPHPVVIDVAGPDWVTVTDEKIGTLPEFKPANPGWLKGAALPGVKAQECSVTGALDPASLVVQPATPAAPAFVRSKDYDVDAVWGTVGRLASGRIAADEPVLLSYRYTRMRLDSVVRRADGSVALVAGTPDVVRPLPPPLPDGALRLANIFLPGPMSRLTADCLFPILETAYPVVTPTGAKLPKSLARLKEGGSLKILAWGDSVTDGSFLPHMATDRWQEQFVTRLRKRFPAARIELVTEAWGGRNTDTYLAEPPGSIHNFAEKVLAVKPDLIVSEFVNDAGFSAPKVEAQYGKLLADFQGIGAEWIILTPHYVRPDWMGLTRQRDIDDDPRPYVKALRVFAAAHDVPLADASARWGRLWRRGLPYLTLLHNNINHPDVRGMALFADSLMELFPSQP